MGKITRPIAPFYVQFELTQKCNHHCFFCYNQTTKNHSSLELSTDECKKLLDEMRVAGVFSVNFNGGEPLTRSDFFEIAEYAKSLGFDIHLNTNGTLITENNIEKLSNLFPSICTSVLSSNPIEHDKRVGSIGAFARMKAGVDLAVSSGIKVEINVCTFRGNYNDLYNIANVMAQQNVHVFCVTRYIMVTDEGRDSYLRRDETISILNLLNRIERDFPTYLEVKLPGPIPYCELPKEYWNQLRKWNTPCMVGYGLCRISPEGNMTPCPLSDFIIGNIRNKSFIDLWSNQHWDKYKNIEHLPLSCRTCEELEECRGGCVFYDECLRKFNLQPNTIKWS